MVGRKRVDFSEALASRVVGDRTLHDDNVRRLTSYFGLGDEPAFDGSRFETYGGSGVEPNRIAPADLVAVTLLSMEIRNKSRSGISTWNALCLEDRSDDISRLLAEIPDDVDLHSLSEEDFRNWVGDGSYGFELWKLLRDDLGMHRVATFKLMARKRPRLFPIKDSRTVDALGEQRDWWRSWYDALQSRDDIVPALRAIRSEAAEQAAAIADLSILRVADIVLWKR